MSSPIENKLIAAAMPPPATGELPFKLERIDSSASLHTVRFSDSIVGQLDRHTSGEMTNGNEFLLYVPAKRDYGWSRKLVGQYATQKAALEALYRLLQCRAMGVDQISRTLLNMRVPSTIQLAGVSIARQNRNTFIIGQVKRPTTGANAASIYLQEMWRQCRF
jgi:hypothetical protein